ncbi:MAG: hypothetical protein WD795_15200 [Woeseia sp.]
MQPGNLNAHWVLSDVRRARDRDHIRELERLIQGEERNPRALAFLCYALGKELEDLEDWDAAFEAFTRGAKTRRSIVDYDEQSEVEMYQAFGKVFRKHLCRLGPSTVPACMPKPIIRRVNWSITTRTGAGICVTSVEGFSTAAAQTSRPGRMKSVPRPAKERSSRPRFRCSFRPLIKDNKLVFNQKRLGNDGAGTAQTDHLGDSGN